MLRTTETSQQRADRLLGEYQTVRNARRASRMLLELSDDPLPEPSPLDRIVKALEPWFVGFHNPLMDAVIVLSLLISAAIVGALLALTWGEPQPPRGLAFQATEAASSPVADSPVGGGAIGEAR